MDKSINGFSKEHHSGNSDTEESMRESLGDECSGTEFSGVADG